MITNTPPFWPMASGPVGCHDPLELRRQEVRRDRLVAMLIRAQRLERWSRCLRRLAGILGDSAGTIRMRGVDEASR